MEERTGYKLMQVTIPNAWVEAFEECRTAKGNTRSAELRMAVREHLVKNGYKARMGVR